MRCFGANKSEYRINNSRCANTEAIHKLTSAIKCHLAHIWVATLILYLIRMAVVKDAVFYTLKHINMLYKKDVFSMLAADVDALKAG